MSQDKLAAAVRFLSVDAIDKAQSGHPGMPLGMADIATVLWRQFLRHNPKNPDWFNRDRFVLSNGHGSMLLYALLHLTGYAVSIEDLKQFRQLHSKTPGHPERLETPGVETTTGPLGQGLANAVGMALAERQLAARFNQPDYNIIDHYTYAFVGDGCLMEGVSHEACSLAGTLGLGRLIVFYDANGISIDGAVDGWFTDNTAERFRAYHWHVIEAVDGHDAAAIEAAITAARAETEKPTLIICHTVIGYGSEAAGQASVHGAPLSKVDIQQLRHRFGWSYPPFEIPAAVYDAWSAVASGTAADNAWLKQLSDYAAAYPEAYHTLLRVMNGDLPDDFMLSSDAFIAAQCKTQKAMATRKASQQCLNHYAACLPELLGGSADLTGSNNTDWSGSQVLSQDTYQGNYVHYGVREFGMSAIMNGMALHGGVVPYGGTFLVFSDYARPAVRLAALMKIRVIFVYTHDSIGLGEDGPTHQPIEHIASLRAMPGLMVWRPADLVETAIAWQQALLASTGPACILLSRQTLPALPHCAAEIDTVKRGGYILSATQEKPDVILIATGSEVQLALKAQDVLLASGIHAQVVSMPCVEQFLSQPRAYQEQVLPSSVSKRVAIEAGSRDTWYRLVGAQGCVIGLDNFGVSAPLSDVFRALGITVERIVKVVQVLFAEKCES